MIYGQYILKHRGLELLHMIAEFFKDENGQIWLFHAKDIYARPSKDLLKKGFHPRHPKKRQEIQKKEEVNDTVVAEIEAFA